MTGSLMIITSSFVLYFVGIIATNLLAPQRVKTIAKMRSQSPSGLWNRQSSSVVEDPENPSGDNMEIEAGNSDGAPLLRSTSGDESSADGTSEGMFIYGHMALSLLFLVAASSIVPLFAAAENEAWRSTNIPYQKTAAGDVILDFRLNHPVVDPPTISCGSLNLSVILLKDILISY